MLMLVVLACLCAVHALPPRADAGNPSPAEAVARAAAESAHPTADLKGLCDHAVGLWYGLAHSGQASARTHWLAIPANRKAPLAPRQPAGALVFYGVVSSGYGHVAIADGNGYIWSTDILRAGKVDRVPWQMVVQKWGLPLLGWSDPVFPGVYDGPRLNSSLTESLAGNPTPKEAVARAAAESAHPTVDLYDLCDHAVGLWYGLSHSGQVSARTHWLAIPGDRKHRLGAQQPEGALVFYGVESNGFGHVAIATGTGHIWSTDILRKGKVDLVPWQLVVQKWGLPLLGWSDPVFPGLYDGPHLRRNATAPNVPIPVPAVVRADPPSIGGPSTSADAIPVPDVVRVDPPFLPRKH